jgi:hypothetical protein
MNFDRDYLADAVGRVHDEFVRAKSGRHCVYRQIGQTDRFSPR